MLRIKPLVYALGTGLLIVLWCAFGEPLAADEGGPHEASAGRCLLTGITRPYREVILGPVPPGLIASITVTEGQAVQEGQLLVALDDAVQRDRTEIARIRAESDVDIELARVRMESAERELVRLTKLSENDAAASKELNDAREAAESGRLEYAKAQREHQQAARAYELERHRLKELKIHAPFDGYVTRLLRHAGETVDEREGIIAMVQLDPLEVSIDCPLGLAPGIRVADQAVVRPVHPHWRPRIGRVVLVSRVADPASQTCKVKLTVDNAAGGWISGLKVQVEFGGQHSRVPTSQPASWGEERTVDYFFDIATMAIHPG